MTDLVYEQSKQLRQDRIPYALATVIAVRGSASARPGSKAVISFEGKNLAGWVGGGCAESFICDQARETLKEAKPRIVTADLDDEIFGLGMPCGGVMDVYIEPVLPPKFMVMPEPKTRDEAELTALVKWHAAYLGFDLETSAEGASLAARDTSSQMTTKFEEIREFIRWQLPDQPEMSRAFSKMNVIEKSLVGIASSLASARGESFLPMNHVAHQDQEKARQSLRLRHSTDHPELWIIGRGRITEELARLATQLHWPVTLVSSVAEASAYPEQTEIKNESLALRESVPSDAMLVIASHHKGDPEWIEKSFASDVAYVGLIASHHRVSLIKEEMIRREMQEHNLLQLSAPAGLQMNCQTPQEIALSLIAEMIVRLHV